MKAKVATSVRDVPPDDGARSRLLSGGELPRGVRDLPDPPEQLFLYGRLPPGPYVGIVGTRQPTPEALKYARQLASELSVHGVSVVSGGALGIDAAAHRGALAAGQPTIVVAPSSFDHPYPPEHRQLFARVIRSGGFLTEHTTGVRAHPNRFFRRNALLVACVQALVIVEAPWRSGARNAAQWARKLGRPLFVVPAAPWNTRARGGLEELRTGARILVTFRDVLSELDLTHGLLLRAKSALGGQRRKRTDNDNSLLLPGMTVGSTVASKRQPAEHVPRGGESGYDLERSLLVLVQTVARHVEELVGTLGESPQVIQHELLTLELSGKIARDAAGRYLATRPLEHRFYGIDAKEIVGTESDR